MATVKFIIQGKNEMTNILVRFVVSRKIDLKRKTDLTIDFKDWSVSKNEPIPKDENLKRLKSKLSNLKRHIENEYNYAISNGIELSGEWLQLQIDIFNKKVPIVELDLFTSYIQKYIDESPYKTNAKKELGLSSGRVQNLKLFKTTVLKYEAENLKNKSILIKNINLKFVEEYKGWMFGKGYSINYVGKNIANIRTICLDAFKNGEIETSPQIKNIKSISEKKEPEDVITLSEDEQETIKKTPLIREALINARKWLLFGCLIGQRGGDLLNITEKNIKDINGIKIIELKQQKTGKLVAIPLLPEALEIIENGLPYKISLPHFNEYIKEICLAAELFTPSTGRKKLKHNQPTIKGIYPKHEIVSSHICRRSFATNFYGRIPTPVLMNITAHGSERMFLSYIGKTTYDNAYQMLEYFSKLTPKTIAPPEMTVIRNTGDQKE